MWSMWKINVLHFGPHWHHSPELPVKTDRQTDWKSPRRLLPSLSLYLSSSSARYIFSTPLPSPLVPFVTAIVTCGCLCPTMHCNPPAPLAGGGTAVTSTERGEVRWGEERRGVKENEEKRKEKMTHYSIRIKGLLGGRGMHALNFYH